IYVTGDDFPLGNLKFVPKGEKDEVFGKHIPKELINEAIQTSPYYEQYLDMVARKPTTKRDEQKKTTSAADKPKKPTPVKKPVPAKQTKPVKEKSTKPSSLKKADKGKVRKVRKGKRSLQLVDEDEKAQPEHEPQVEDEEYDLQRGIQISLDCFSLELFQAPVVEGKGKAIATDKHDDTFANVVRDTPSPADAETGAGTDKTNSGDTKMLDVDEDRGKNVSNTVAQEERIVELDEDQAGSDPEHERLKRLYEEHVHLKKPLSLSGTLSSMKNLDDAFTYSDQFLNDKPNKEEPDKANVEIEVESMVTVPIHQASSSAPPLSTPVIIISSPKPVSPPIQEPVFTATTTTTTITLLPPPPP
ncbi:hypothetical protein Tco_0799749, partial [Tanacetum coccineum]